MAIIVVYVEPPIAGTSDAESIVVVKSPRIVAGVHDSEGAIDALRAIHVAGVDIDIRVYREAAEARVFMILEANASTFRGLVDTITATLTGL
jgi:hypothetical protein